MPQKLFVRILGETKRFICQIIAKANTLPVHAANWVTGQLLNHIEPDEKASFVHPCIHDHTCHHTWQFQFCAFQLDNLTQMP